MDKLKVFKTLVKNDISGTSPPIKEFEDELSKSFDRRFSIAVSNGSSALDLALQSLDLKEGDEVIVPSFTIISCLSAIIRAGAVPIFCDVDKTSWNMTLDLTKQKVTKKTKAVLMVHLYGLVGEAKEIEDYCLKKNIILIEDSAEAHGQIIDGKKCGSFGKISTFSFYANKHITTGEGGAVLTNDEIIYKKIKQMANLDFNDKRFQHSNLFWNYRLSGIQASLGLSQINSLNKTIIKKIKQGKKYNDFFKNSEQFQIPPFEINGVVNHYWVYGILLNKDGIRDSVMKDLYENGIETRPFFWPLHLQDALPSKYRLSNNSLKTSEHLGANGFYIPIGQHINTRKQKFISQKIIEVVNKY